MKKLILAAAVAATLAAPLSAQAQKIGVNDLHIATHARSEGLTLVTNNLGERGAWGYRPLKPRLRSVRP